MLLKEHREKVIDIAKKAYREKLIPLTMGNFSIRDQETGYICITPSGMEYEKLEPQDIVVMDVQGNIIDGIRRPSIENPLHREVYKRREDVNGIAHTHSTYATAWACCNKEIPATVAEVASTLGGPIECAPYRPMSTTELAEVTAEHLRDRLAVLMANHGALAVGADLEKAYSNSVVVEEGAKVAYIATQLGGMILIPDSECRFLRKTIDEKYGQK